MSEELKPCPMCGAKPVSKDKHHLAICHEPHCFFAHPLHNANFNIISSDSVAEQIKAWNTRPAEDDLKAEIEGLKADLDAQKSVSKIAYSDIKWLCEEVEKWKKMFYDLDDKYANKDWKR